MVSYLQSIILITLSDEVLLRPQIQQHGESVFPNICTFIWISWNCSFALFLQLNFRASWSFLLTRILCNIFSMLAMTENIPCWNRRRLPLNYLMGLGLSVNFRWAMCSDIKHYMDLSGFAEVDFGGMSIFDVLFDGFDIFSMKVWQTFSLVRSFWKSPVLCCSVIRLLSMREQ